MSDSWLLPTYVLQLRPVKSGGGVCSKTLEVLVGVFFFLPLNRAKPAFSPFLQSICKANRLLRVALY